MLNKTPGKHLKAQENPKSIYILPVLGLLCLVILAGLYLSLLLRHQEQQRQEQALADQLDALTLREQELQKQLADRQEELDRRQSELDRQLEELDQCREELEISSDALAQAMEDIRRLEEYTLLTPEGEPPEYTQLYPDMYAQPWDGEMMTDKKVVCLTFDDGPSSNTDKILEILDRYQIKGTFFIIGKTGEADQQRMRDIVAAGHTLAIHSWSHSYSKIYASVEAYLDDFHQLYQWIYDVTGTYPQVFRFPGGSINSYNRGTYQEIISEMLRRGFLYYDWNASAEDATAKLQSADVIRENSLKGIGRNLVVLLSHDSAARTTTVDALPSIIEGYQSAGYTFAPLTPGVTPIIMGYPALKK